MLSVLLTTASSDGHFKIKCYLIFAGNYSENILGSVSTLCRGVCLAYFSQKAT